MIIFSMKSFKSKSDENVLYILNHHHHQISNYSMGIIAIYYMGRQLDIISYSQYQQLPLSGSVQAIKCAQHGLKAEYFLQRPFLGHR